MSLIEIDEELERKAVAARTALAAFDAQTKSIMLERDAARVQLATQADIAERHLAQAATAAAARSVSAEEAPLRLPTDAGQVIALGEQSWPANYLSPSDAHHYEVYIEATAKRLHNPLGDFSEKVKELSPELQAVALTKFMDSPEYREIPESKIIEASGTLPAIQLLAKYVTGADIEVTPENAGSLWRQLIFFV